jgi:hypothetical protein
MSRSHASVALFALGLGLGLLGWSSPASAQSTIKTPGARTHYVLELEPHVLFGPFDPPGFGSGQGVGLGFRGTVEILGEGFIRPLNDSIGIGFGADWIHYDSDDDFRGRCARYESAPGGTRVCVEIEGAGGETDYLYLPVVMQWNFWLHRYWSVFGEPGLGLHLLEFDEVHFDPFILYLGGRFHPTSSIAITARVGYPSFSLGASFFL